MKELDKEERLGIVVDEVGGKKVAAEQIAGFFLHREKQYKEGLLKQRDIILAEQKAMRYRWRQDENT